MTGPMYNELERLRDSAPLQLLLGHYAEPGAAAPGEWQDRAVDLPGVEPRLLSRLHGQLLAHGWVEQDTYQPTSPEAQPHRTRYRITEAGLQASKQALCGQTQGDVLAGMAALAAARKEIRAEKRSRQRRRRKSGEQPDRAGT